MNGSEIATVESEEIHLANKAGHRNVGRVGRDIIGDPSSSIGPWASCRHSGSWDAADSTPFDANLNVSVHRQSIVSQLSSCGSCDDDSDSLSSQGWNLEDFLDKAEANTEGLASTFDSKSGNVQGL
jgi:hypothetical protein